MEKFGIFELLDALSAIVSPDGAQNPQQNNERPSADDPAYAPPVYGAVKQENGEKKQPTLPAGGEGAFDAFVKRHEALSRKIDRNAK